MNILLLLLSVIFINQVNNVKATPTKNIAVVFGFGSSLDNGWNSLALEGLLRAQADFDINLEMTLPINQSEQNAAIERYASDVSTAWDLIITLGLSTVDGVNTLAVSHPNQQYSLIGSSLTRANVSSIKFKHHEGSFLAGVLAATVSTSETIGFIGGLNIPIINEFRSGYEQGAKWVNPDIIVITNYINSFNDIPGTKSITEQLIGNDIDVVYAAAGVSGLGTFEAVSEARDQNTNVYAIGVDYNQDNLAPGSILSSMMLRYDMAIYNEIQSVVQQFWVDGTKVLGLSEEGVGLTDMSLVLPIRDSLCTATQTRFERIQDVGQAIINGTIMVNSTLMVPSEFNTIPHLCSFIAPTIPLIVVTTITEPTTITEATTVTAVITLTKTAEGFGMVLLSISFIGFIIIGRRRNNL